MIKVWYGKKGTGKTKALVQSANDMVESCTGDVVFIDHNAERMYDLKHQIRYVNTSEFFIDNCSSFAGFISGIISGDYDIGAIFIDGMTHITKGDETGFQSFFSILEKLAKQFSIEFYISMSSESDELPSYVKPYIA